MSELDLIQINFSEGNVLVLNLCLGILMFGVALDMQPSDFKYVFKAPKSIITGLISQWILLPGMTVALIYAIHPAYSLALGMALIAACPGGNVSNYTVHISRSNTALSIIMTSITTLLCVFTTPLIFKTIKHFIPDDHVVPIDFDIPFLSMAGIILKLIIIPLAVGLVIKHRFPDLTSKIKKTVQNLSFVIFIGFVIAAISSNLDNLVNHLSIVFVIVLIHNGLALFIGYSWSKWLVRLPKADSRSISIETGIQNSGLALIIVFNFFDANGGMALIAAWWSIWHLISAMSIALYWRKSESKIIITNP